MAAPVSMTRLQTLQKKPACSGLNEVKLWLQPPLAAEACRPLATAAATLSSCAAIAATSHVVGVRPLSKAAFTVCSTARPAACTRSRCGPNSTLVGSSWSSSSLADPAGVSAGFSRLVVSAKLTTDRCTLLKMSSSCVRHAAWSQLVR